uniref:E3 ubiquitin-protein ligase PPP1R11 n=1 Tax=Plectus sambesii TaxID=2011161 RepID=A0A914X263_9BILA
MDVAGGSVGDRATAEATGTITITQSEDQQPSEESNEQLVLRLTQPSSSNTGPRVRWATETVDNEFMQKKKSKCCCVYKKPKQWNDPSDSEDSDSDCETGNCRGHVEKRHEHNEDGGGGQGLN